MLGLWRAGNNKNIVQLISFSRRQIALMTTGSQQAEARPLMFYPKYKLTDRILSQLTAVAEAKAVIERAKLLPKQELRLRRSALVRMTHASTKIEGNALNIRQVEAVAERKKVEAPARDIYEVENYLKALRFITKLVEQKSRFPRKLF